MDYLYIGKIVDTHGIKGELRIKSNFERKELVFKKDFIIYVGNSYEPLKITNYRHHKEFDMITIEGYDNINQVLKYLKLNVYAKKSDIELNDTLSSNKKIVLDMLNLNSKYFIYDIKLISNTEPYYNIMHLINDFSSFKVKYICPV